MQICLTLHTFNTQLTSKNAIFDQSFKTNGCIHVLEVHEFGK